MQERHKVPPIIDSAHNICMTLFHLQIIRDFVDFGLSCKRTVCDACLFLNRRNTWVQRFVR